MIWPLGLLISDIGISWHDHSPPLDTMALDLSTAWSIGWLCIGCCAAAPPVCAVFLPVRCEPPHPASFQLWRSRGAVPPLPRTSLGGPAISAKCCLQHPVTASFWLKTFQRPGYVPDRSLHRWRTRRHFHQAPGCHRSCDRHRHALNHIVCLFHSSI